MQCFIYKSLKKQELYLYLDKADNFSILPDNVRENLGRLEFVMELNLSSDRKLARVDVTKVIDSLANNGFFIQMPPIINELSIAQANKFLH